MLSVVDVLERLRVAAGGDTVFLTRADVDTLELVIVGGQIRNPQLIHDLPRAGSLTEQVISDGRDVVTVPDLWSQTLNIKTRTVALAAKAESAIGSVITVDGTAWGVVVVTSSRRPCPFGDEHIPVLRAAATELAGRLATRPRPHRGSRSPALETAR